MQKLTAVFFFALLVFNAVASAPWLIQDPTGTVYLLIGGTKKRAIPS